MNLQHIKNNTKELQTNKNTNQKVITGLQSSVQPLKVSDQLVGYFKLNQGSTHFFQPFKLNIIFKSINQKLPRLIKQNVTE